RAEDRLGPTLHDRLHHGRQELRGVLPVAVEEHDDVPPVLDGVPVAPLLVAAVAEVGRVSDDRERQVRGLLIAEADQVGAVLAVIVADEHLVDLAPHLLGDAVEHLRQGRRGVVRDHEDPDLRHGTARYSGGLLLGSPPCRTPSSSSTASPPRAPAPGATTAGSTSSPTAGATSSRSTCSATARPTSPTTRRPTTSSSSTSSTRCPTARSTPSASRSGRGSS